MVFLFFAQYLHSAAALSLGKQWRKMLLKSPERAHFSLGAGSRRW
jgi:hypothetical protein